MMAQQHSTNVLNVVTHNAECRVLFIAMLNVIMLSVVVVSVVAPTF